MIIKLKEIEEKLKTEKEEKKKQIDIKIKEIESKDKIILSIGSSNKKLLVELEDLKKEVDEKLDKIGMKQLVDKEKEIQKKKKELPYEQVLKIKEKELKNAINLIDIYKKDKDNLQKNLDEKLDGKKIRDLEDKLKDEENKNKQYEIELRLCTKLKEEHNKCELMRENYEKEKKSVFNDIKFFKEKNKELNIKLKEEEEKHSKLNALFASLKAENKGKSLEGISSDVNLPDININSNKPNSFLIKSKELNLEKYWKLLDTADKNNTDGKLFERSPGKEARNNKLGLNKSEVKKKISDRQKLSVSLTNKNFKYEIEEAAKLFGYEEKEILLKILPAQEIEKLEKKFDIIQSTKINSEKKFMMEMRILNKKVSEFEDRLEYTNLHNKELEQRNKILGYQINEYKNENKIITRKVNDLNSIISNTKLNLKRKEDENKMLLLRIQELQKSIQNQNNNVDTNNNEIEEDNRQEEIEDNEQIDKNDDENEEIGNYNDENNANNEEEN